MTTGTGNSRNVKFESGSAKKPFQLSEAFELSGLLMMMFGPELKLIWINEGDILIKVTLRTPRHSSSDPVTDSQKQKCQDHPLEVHKL